MSREMEAQAVRRVRRWWRSLWAVVAGLFAIVLLSLITDLLMQRAGAFAPGDAAAGPWVAALAYRGIYAAAGARLTARLAPAPPMLHVCVLLAIGVGLGLVGAIAFWNEGAELGPRWYIVGVIPVSAIGTLAGGIRLRAAARDPRRTEVFPSPGKESHARRTKGHDAV